MLLALAIKVVLVRSGRREFSSPTGTPEAERDCIVCPLLWLVGKRCSASSISSASILRGKGSVGRLIFGGMPFWLALVVRPAGRV